MHIVLIAVGSAGDVYPCIGLAREFVAKGHRVTLIAGIPFETIIRNSGIEFVPIASRADFEASARAKPILATPYQELHFIRFGIGWNLEILKCVLRTQRQSEVLLLVADRHNIWADAMLHKTHAIPVVRLMIDLPYFYQKGLPNERSRRKDRLRELLELRWHQRMQIEGWRVGRRQISRLRQIIRGMPKVALWPKWVVENPPSGMRLDCLPTGFVYPAPSEHGQVGDDLAALLSRNRFVVFFVGTEGTVKDWVEQFATVSRDACGILGMDCLLLGCDRPSAIPDAQPWFLAKKFVPLERILPRALAVVHHGGIGTAAIAMRYGIPKLMVPRVFMQPSNVEWLKKLGIGAYLEPSKYNTASVTQLLRSIVQSNDCRRMCQQAREKSHSDPNCQLIAAQIEQFGLNYWQTMRSAPG